MKCILSLVFLYITFALSITGLCDSKLPEDKLPEVGSTYMLDKAKFKVVGASDEKPFEYTSTGESLQILVGKIPGTIVIVPDEGNVVKVDPSIPMVWVAGEPHKEFVQNAYLKKNAKNKEHILLEYIR